jgi:hypothetical protein
MFVFVVMAVGFAGATLVHGQAPGNSSAATARDALGDLKFRNPGPAVAGGRVAAVAGVPGNPNVIYVGAAGGGVWKSTDGGC